MKIRVISAAIALAALVGCTSDPMYNTVSGGAGGAMTGCAIGAMVGGIPTAGVGAAPGCAFGAWVGGASGAGMGLATTNPYNQPPPYAGWPAWSAIMPPPQPQYPPPIPLAPQQY